MLTHSLPLLQLPSPQLDVPLCIDRGQCQRPEDAASSTRLPCAPTLAAARPRSHLPATAAAAGPNTHTPEREPAQMAAAALRQSESAQDLHARDVAQPGLWKQRKKEVKSVEESAGAPGGRVPVG